MSQNGFPGVLLQEVVEWFDTLIGRFGEHAVAAGDEVYVEPYVLR
jgi:hypothetical protein